MTKKISFIPANPTVPSWGIPPSPSIRNIPEWYRKMSKYMFGEKSLKVYGSSTNLTAKSCLPFFDSLTLGYIVPLSVDVLVEQRDEGPYISWRFPDEVVSTHSLEQVPGMPFPVGFSKTLFKWHNFYKIRTPKGWSSLIVHPMQRNDLPFLTVSAVVDTDKLDLPVNLPFFLSDSFEGKIEKGTPIAQIIPVKRDSWKSFISEPEKNNESKDRLFFSFIEKYYKNFFWDRKQYS